MKKVICAVFIFCYAMTTTNAQNLLTPANAEMIITIRAGEMFDKLPLSEIENMPYLKEYFNEVFKSVGNDVTSLSQLGVDMNKTSQLFVDIQDEDGTMMMGMALPVNDQERLKSIFEIENQMVKSVAGADMIVKDGMSIVLTNGTALLTYALENPSTNRYDDSFTYYQDEIYFEEAEEVIEYEEIDIIEEDIEIEEMEMVEPDYENEIAEESYEEYNERIAKEREEEYLREIKEREEQLKKQMEEKALVTEKYVMKLISDSKLNPSPDYLAYEVDEKADISILIRDYGNIMKMYQTMTYNPYSYNYMNFMGGDDILSNMYNGIEYMTGNGYFRKEGIEMEIKQKFSDEFAEMNKNLMGDFNEDMLKYIPFNSEIGHVSLALNTENLINYYYDIMETTIGAFIPNEKEAMEAAIAFAKIMIDEEALGNLIKGDAYFGVTDLNTYQLEYVDYEYDENWNATEVIKIKEEIRPDFLFMFSSDEYDFISKLMKVISKETRDEFKNMGDYYMMKASRNVPLDIYCMHKNGIVFVFTSQSLYDSIMNGGTKVKAADSKMLVNNIMSMKFDAQKLFSKIPLADMSEMEKEMILSARENLGEISMTQEKMQGNIMTSKIFMESKGDYSNSLRYFVGLFNEFERIENDFRYNRN